MNPVTYTGIDYVKGTDSLKVTVRFNYDLFLRDYQQTVFDDISIDTLRTFRPFPQDLANYYLNSKISIMAGDRQVTGKLLSLGEDNTDIVFNMLFRINRRTRSITVRNTILTGLSSNFPHGGRCYNSAFSPLGPV